MAFQFDLIVPQVTLAPKKSEKTNLWSQEFFRWGAQTHHFAKARNSHPKSSVLKYIYDYFFDDLEVEADEKELDTIPYKWFESFTVGSWNRKKQQHVFTRPNLYRTTMLSSFLQNEGFLPQIALRPHLADYEAFMDMAESFGYDAFGDTKYLSASFRGSFLSQKTFDGGVDYTLLLIFRIGDERLFRTRELRFRVYANGLTTLMAALEGGEINLKGCTDGYAAFGTNYGRIWSSVSPNSHFHLDGFKWMSKKRRCHKMIRRNMTTHDEQYEIFNLTINPAQIELANTLLNSCE